MSVNDFLGAWIPGSPLKSRPGLGEGIKVTVVDTPASGNSLEEEEASIEQLVDFLKDDLQYVNVFVLTFKESDKRLTRGLQSMMKLLGEI